MKFDKEMLVKQRFWVGLIASVVMFVGLIFSAVIFAGEMKKANEKTFKDKETAVKNLNDIKRDPLTQLLAAKAKELTGQKDKVWAEAWKGQEHLMSWPSVDEPLRSHLENEASFGEPLSDTACISFAGARGWYESEFPITEVEGRLKPIAPAPGKTWANLIHRASFKSNLTPTTEEVWLAQEDVWVQNELINVVHEALESAARFENYANFKRVDIPKGEQEAWKAAADKAAATPPAGSKPATGGTTPNTGESKEAKTFLVRQRFQNPRGLPAYSNWQLDLVLEYNEAKKEWSLTKETKLINRDHSDFQRHALGVDILIGQTNVKPVTIRFVGDKPAESFALDKPVALPGFTGSTDDGPVLIVLLKGDADDPEPKDTRRLRYRSPNWEMELFLAREGNQSVLTGASQLTNITATHRTLSLSAASFDLLQAGKRITPADDKGKMLPVNPPNDWLAWHKSSPLLPKTKTPLAIHFDAREEFDSNGYEKNPLQVRQLFELTTSPIKYVTAIEIPGSLECKSFNSHRTANLELKPAAQFPTAEKEKENAPSGTGTGGPGGMSPGGPGGGMSTGGPQQGGGQSKGPDTSKTPNDIVRNRYISVTAQVRHMPVALELIIEQSHLQDVLTAVANSRLRIQITQVQWKRAEGIKPSGVQTDPSDPNLIEVAIYGIAALYERYPDHFQITQKALNELKDQLPKEVQEKLINLKDKDYPNQKDFLKALKDAGLDEKTLSDAQQKLILNRTRIQAK